MNYIVVDFEWNQTRAREMLLPDGRLLMGEIIQIGAVKLNSEFRTVGTFKSLVRPIYYRKMHSRVRQLTGINNEMLKSGITFKTAYKAFTDFCGSDFATITWGESDIPILKENISANNLGKWNNPNYDLQVIFTSQFKQKNQSLALERAAEMCGIEVTEQLHDAFNDAHLTALIAERLNMKLGIKEYKTKPVCDLLDLDYLTFETVKNVDIQRIRTDPRIKYAICPFCKTPMCSNRLIPQSATKKLSVMKCPEHGEFIQLIRIMKNYDGTDTVHKFLYEMTPELSGYYAKKLDTADKKKERFLAKINRTQRKKAETK